MKRVTLEIDGHVDIKPSNVFSEDMVIMEYEENGVKNVYYLKREWVKGVEEIGEIAGRSETVLNSAD